MDLYIVNFTVDSQSMLEKRHTKEDTKCLLSFTACVYKAEHFCIIVLYRRNVNVSSTYVKARTIYGSINMAALIS